MPKRPSKEKNPTVGPKRRSKEKNPAAVALGRLGGLQRGRTVMTTIPAEKRIEIARHAVNARWAQVRADKATHSKKTA